MSTSQKTAIKLSPADWKNNPKTVLSLGFLQTTTDAFGVNISVLDKNNSLIKKLSANYQKRDFSYFNIDQFEIKFDLFPITIQAEITCDSVFDLIPAQQMAVGTKQINGMTMPVCYQATLFCNDNANNPGRDLDYNDFVLIAQLFNKSTD